MTAWTEPRIADVRRLAALHWRAADIAAELGEGATKNAVISLARRQRIPLDSQRGPDSKPRPGRRAAMNMPRVKRLSVQASAPPAAPAPPKGNPIEFMELTNVTCRFPIGENLPYKFCGYPDADLSSGRPYCRDCARMAYGHSSGYSEARADKFNAMVRRNNLTSATAAIPSVDPHTLE